MLRVSRNNSEQLRRARRIAVTLGVTVALLGAVVLVRSLFHLTSLTRLHSSFTEMQVSAALAFLISGAVTASAVLCERARFTPLLLRAGGSAVVILGFLTARSIVPMGVFFIVAGAALLALDQASHRAPHTTEWLAFAAFWIGGLTLTGYLLGVPEISHSGSHLSTALHSSLAMLGLAVAILCARPERGLAAIAVSSSSAGTVLRRLVPETLLVPPLGMLILVKLLPRLRLFEAKLGLAASRAGGVSRARLGNVSDARVARSSRRDGHWFGDGEEARRTTRWTGWRGLCGRERCALFLLVATRAKGRIGVRWNRYDCACC